MNADQDQRSDTPLCYEPAGANPLSRCVQKLLFAPAMLAITFLLALIVGFIADSSGLRPVQRATGLWIDWRRMVRWGWLLTTTSTGATAVVVAIICKSPRPERIRLAIFLNATAFVVEVLLCASCLGFGYMITRNWNAD